MPENKKSTTTKLKINQLRFYVPLWRDGIENYNIFDNYHVQVSVARYVTGKWKMPNKDSDGLYRSPLEQWAFYCFGDLWSRYEYEVGIGEPFKKDDGSWNGVKKDVFELFILPNAGILKQMVDRVTVSSARAVLSEDRARLSALRKKVK